jgi:hypothetical protein
MSILKRLLFCVMCFFFHATRHHDIITFIGVCVYSVVVKAQRKDVQALTRDPERHHLTYTL